MDNHPIPQDITGFQFKLIGNMTVKQFVYLAIGAILAWLFFFVINFPAIIKWPLSIFSIAFGAIFAFVPVDGRPMDIMLTNFIRAIISPTQFIYQKEGIKIENQNIPKSEPLRLHSLFHKNSQANAQDNLSSGFSSPAYLNTFPQAPTPITQTMPQPIQNTQMSAQVIQQIPSVPANFSVQNPLVTQPQPQLQPQPISPIVQFPEPSRTPAIIIEEEKESGSLKKKNKELNELKEENEKLEEELESLKKQLDETLKAKDEAAKIIASMPPPAPVIPIAPSPSQDELERQLIESTRQREALEKELLNQRSKAMTPTNIVTPSQAPAAPTQPTQRVRSVLPGMEKSAGLPSAPEAPNLITGIVKDPRGNPLQNILIEVKDQDSNPVRAFKTNGLGKFASATSLSNGKYLITFEDAKETNKFDAVEIELVGTPVMPLEIFSVDPREELRRELFK